MNNKNFAALTLQRFFKAVKTDRFEIYGGFIFADETIEFLLFTADIQGHDQAVAQKLMPADCTGGFSIGVRARAVQWFVFRSVLNHPGIYLHPSLQQAIIDMLPTKTGYQVYR